MTQETREGFTLWIAKFLTIVGKGPLVFESAVFKRSGGRCALEMYRYSTWEEAALGHRALVEKWRDVAMHAEEPRA